MGPTNSAKNYVLGTTYELFIRSAFGCKRGEHGAEVAYFQNLLETEEGKNYVRIPYPKQLSTIKGYLEKAFQRISKLELPEEEREEIILIQKQIFETSSARQIAAYLERALKIISKYRKAH